MNPDEPMTPHYASLSLVVGLIAGYADEYLGGAEFGEMYRACSMGLTDEFMDELICEVIRRGVPEEEIKRYLRCAIQVCLRPQAQEVILRAAGITDEEVEPS